MNGQNSFDTPNIVCKLPYWPELGKTKSGSEQGLKRQNLFYSMKTRLPASQIPKHILIYLQVQLILEPSHLRLMAYLFNMQRSSFLVAEISPKWKLIKEDRSSKNIQNMDTDEKHHGSQNTQKYTEKWRFSIRFIKPYCHGKSWLSGMNSQ